MTVPAPRKPRAATVRPTLPAPSESRRRSCTRPAPASIEHPAVRANARPLSHGPPHCAGRSVRRGRHCFSGPVDGGRGRGDDRRYEVLARPRQRGGSGAFPRGNRRPVRPSRLGLRGARRGERAGGLVEWWDTTGGTAVDGSSDGPSVQGSSDCLVSQNIVDSGVTDGPLPACTWPASYASVDAGNVPSGQCRAARTWLECTDGTSVSGGLSDDPGVNAPGFGVCHALCAPTEYGVACQNLTGGPLPSWPSCCHSPEFSVPPSFEGTAEQFCCPCSGTDVGDGGGGSDDGAVTDGGRSDGSGEGAGLNDGPLQPLECPSDGPYAGQTCTPGQRCNFAVGAPACGESCTCGADASWTNCMIVCG